MPLYSRHLVIVCKRQARRLARFIVVIPAVVLIVVVVTARVLSPGKLDGDRSSSILKIQRNDTGRQANLSYPQIKQARLGLSSSSSSSSSESSLQPQLITHWRQLFDNPEIFRHNLTVSQAFKMAYLRQRVLHAEKKCRQGWHPEDSSFFGLKMLLHYDRRRRLAYCQAAKSGSTYWGRIFAFLTRRKEMVELGIERPSDIEKMKIHNGELGSTLLQQWPDLQAHILRSDTLKFIFTRNPYLRLWGVFLDKFYLLGEWEGQGRSDHWCNGFDSFQNFLQLAVASDDHHVLPISEMCDPCQFKPHVIGHVETFGPDAAFVLRQALYGFLATSDPYQKTVETELKSTISSNFYILLAVRNEKDVCLDEKSLSERLWRVFQLKGHISSNTTFPGDLADYSEGAITPVFLEAARNSFISEQKSKEQKHGHIVEAYRSIPFDLVHKLQTRYRGDFEIFDYDPKPPA